MTTDQILSLAPALAEFLAEFADCFGRSEPYEHLRHYVRGQLSNLQRKSVEPIALFNNVAPRTLQEFLNTDVWDHPRARDRVQQIVARDHEDPKAIGIIDDSGHPKSGKKTPGVQWQYCGRLGKTANCVVTVQLAFSSYDTRFRTMLDTELFLPESWSNDRERCRNAGIPDNVVYRPKHHIALELLDRGEANGVHLEWITADIWYSEKPDFLTGLEQRHRRYVVEIPRNLRGWLDNPGAEPRYPARGVEELCHHAKQMTRQQWTPFHIKNTEKGPMVWKVRSAPLSVCRGGQVLSGYHLLWAYDPLHPDEEKWFLVWDPLEDKLETWLHVAFARWPVERILEDKKSELGFSHFEVRKYQAVMRHLYITMLSHLFLARRTELLRGGKPGDHAEPGPRRRQRVGQHILV
ncbi:MAG: IS701 family transposase [Planctomycetes bacterium]|nr:IS701 family transposase [Planctomycetota bacterium]